ncbi:Receptor-type tyrosine-protein phosphatase eta, partial [Eurypyga helias]
FTALSPIHELKAEYVGMTSVSLTWVVNDTASSSYTYRIEVVNGTSVRNLTSNVTKVEITELLPKTLYNFTVFAVVNDDETEGEGVSISLYTKPSPIHELKAEYVGAEKVNLTWVVNDTASSSYTYRIEVVNGTSVRNLTSNVTKVEITELLPGTMYNFMVFAVAADGQTEGEGVPISPYTKPSPIHELKAEYVGAEKVNLTWVVNDTASNPYTYRIEVVNGNSVRNLMSDVTKVEITDLIPGIQYNFTVFAVAADGQTEGEGVPISLYTRKSQLLAALFLVDILLCSSGLSLTVQGLKHNTSLTCAVVNGTSVRNLTSNVTKVEITELLPGTMYNFMVFAVAADGQTAGEGVSISLYT